MSRESQVANYIAFKNVNKTIKPNNIKINYSFVSLFNPSSIKNLTLYHRNFNNGNSATNIRGSFRNYKVLVKQSYLMSAWFYYYANDTMRSKKIKGFVTLPCRQTKHTAAKAPMAHKTFSQEQFVIKYYYLTFSTESKSSLNFNIDTINKSMLVSSTFADLSSFSATNMLLLYKIKSWFLFTDNNFFSYK